MEPALDERGDDHETTGGPPLHRAAMEPALDERGDPGRPCWLRSPRRSRNGARSRRAGRPLRILVNRLSSTRAAMEPALDERGDPSAAWAATPPTRGPQWSPLSTSGATTHLTGQHHHRLWPQWSPLSTSGATTFAQGDGTERGSRNGARSRRAGRQAGVVGGHQGSTAAMEPALDERGDARRRLVAVISARTPQWSPLSTSGATTS